MKTANKILNAALLITAGGLLVIGIVTIATGSTVDGILRIIYAIVMCGMAYVSHENDQLKSALSFLMNTQVDITAIDEKSNNVLEAKEQLEQFKADITPDMIKSVYAAAGICKQVNEHTDAKNLEALWEKLKDMHKAATLAAAAKTTEEETDE